MKITNWHEIESREVIRLGQQEFDRRILIARQKARKIADDPSWFAEDCDREGIFQLMFWRLQSIAVQLTSFDKFESASHDTLGCAVCKMMESGKII